MPNSYTGLYYHVVFSTKDRRPLIESDWQDRLYAYMGGIVVENKGRVLATGGMPDHVHLLASFNPVVAVADMLRLIKTNSSKWVNQTVQPVDRFAWQDGYGAFSVSVSQIERVRKYIQEQAKHHATQSFQEELLAILKNHGVEYDERYLWT